MQSTIMAIIKMNVLSDRPGTSFNDSFKSFSISVRLDSLVSLEAFSVHPSNWHSLLLLDLCHCGRRMCWYH